MKKLVSALFSLMIIFAFAGCDLSSNDSDNVSNASDSSLFVSEPVSSIENPVNLDLENTIIIENTPTTGKWKKMAYESPGLDGRSADRLIKIASNFGLALEKKDLLLQTHQHDPNQEGEWLIVPITEATEKPLLQFRDYLREDAPEFPYETMKYIGDIYLEIQAPTGGRIEYDNRQTVNSVLGHNWHATGSWRPEFYMKSYTGVDLNDETATCVLNGKTVKIVDALKNAENYVLENEILFPNNFGAKVLGANVLSYENTDNQVLDIRFEYTIDGVVLDGAQSISVRDENGKYYKAFSTSARIAMLTENTIDWAWLPTVDGATEFSEEECEIAISREKACEIVSQKLSQQYTFNVEEIQLMYMAQNQGDWIHDYLEPKWRFYITGIKAQEYSRIYAYVSAVDGSVQILEVV